LRHSYDVIHIIQISPLAAMATLIGELTQKPTIISVQNAGPGEPQLAQLKRGATLMVDTLPLTSFLNVDFMDWVIGASEIINLPLTALGGKVILNYLRKSNAIYQVLSTGGQSYLTSHGFRASQIVHIPGSVDTQKFRPAPQRRPDPSRPERDIICVASLDYRKGIDVLLHTWGRMMSAPTEWRTSLKPQLLLVGEGKIRPQLERIVAQLGIAESVEFLGARTDIVDLLQRAWCFVLPSRWEGMPNALLEAMACGLPCVATRVSGSEDIITNGINGLLLEPEQPAELAQALQRIIEDTNLAQRLGQEARATVVRDYQLPMIVEQCLQLYRGLLSTGKNGNDEKRHSEEIPLQASWKGGVLDE
jgi:glycosyltransferase involved in cell wall biosynthesis